MINFIELFEILIRDNHFNKSPEIEILKGYHIKPTSIKGRLKKIIRKYKFKNGN